MATIISKPPSSMPPRPGSIVTDSMGYLSDEGKAALDARLVQHRADTKQETGVWIGPTPDGVGIEEWCQVAFNAWGVGRKGKDDGVVLFIFPAYPPRGWWQITVGWGVEKYLSNREAREIAVYTPKEGLDRGDRDKAVNDTVDAILAQLKGKP